jgi:hypothetical protein
MAEASSYQGKARILDLNGVMYDVGLADLTTIDSSTGEWGGTIRLFENSALATKSITSYVELSDGRRLKAQVGPRSGDAEGELMYVRVAGVDRTTL